jgi:hypothetical protein
MVADHVLCPRCRHANPPENRFCGSCGASFEASTELVVPQENKLRVIARPLLAMPGPAGKAFAVALVTLAVRAALSKLLRRSKAEVRTTTLATRERGTALSEPLLAQSLEVVLIQELGVGYWSRVFAWRAVRQFVISRPTDKHI